MIVVKIWNIPAVVIIVVVDIVDVVVVAVAVEVVAMDVKTVKYWWTNYLLWALLGDQSSFGHHTKRILQRIGGISLVGAIRP